jgi:membrane-associated HD superfamily phosphohydrolase
MVKLKRILPESAKVRLWLFFSFIILLSNAGSLNQDIGNAKTVIPAVDDAITIALCFAIIIIAIAFNSRKVERRKQRDNLILVLLMLLLLVYLIDMEIRGGNIMGAAAGDAAGIVMVIQMIANRFL